MEYPKLDFIGIGAKKSATSWLSRCLSEHPEICMPSRKETHFFSIDKKYEKGPDFYKSFFDDCESEKIIGEFSTSYLTSLKTPQRLKKHCPKVKAVVILRNPIERVFSHFKHMISKGKFPKDEKIEQAINRFPAIMEFGMYSKYLENWFSYFNKENFLILFYEEVKENPEQVLRKVFGFLNVDENFTPDSLSKTYNTSKDRMSPLFKPINRIYLKLRKRKAGRWLIKTAKKLKFSKVLDVFIKKTEKKKDFSKEDMLYLKGMYKEEIEDLEDLLNVNLSMWKN